MDYGHHDAIHFHRVYSLQAVDRCLNHHGTMMGNQVMMMVIHTRSPERSEGEAKDLYQALLLRSNIDDRIPQYSNPLNLRLHDITWLQKLRRIACKANTAGRTCSNDIARF